MGHRPDYLPFSATRVIKASRCLSSGVKLVWLEDRALDQGPEGAWIGAGKLADRLGMSHDNVERHRRELLRLGLHEKRSRGPGKSASWFPTLPIDCIPPTRPTPDRVHALATRLDAHIEARRKTKTDGDLAVEPTTSRSGMPEPTRLGRDDIQRVGGRERTPEPPASATPPATEAPPRDGVADAGGREGRREGLPPPSHLPEGGETPPTSPPPSEVAECTDSLERLEEDVGAVGQSEEGRELIPSAERSEEEPEVRELRRRYERRKAELKDRRHK